MAIGNTLSSRLIHKGKWIMGTRSMSSWGSSVDSALKHPVTEAEKVNVGVVKGRFPFFDMAHQGFVPERDAKSIWNNHGIGIDQSYAKNMGLYDQRVGCLSVVCESQNKAVAAKRNQDVQVMADRIIGMQTALPGNFEKLGSLLSRKHITNQIGMNRLITRTYSSLAPETEQVVRPHLRVLSPHLPVYEPQNTSTLSILNRITGSFLAAGILFFYLCVKIGSICFTNYDFFQFIFYSSKLTLIFIEISALALSYHVYASIRHLIFK